MLATVRIAMTNSSPLRQPRPAPLAHEQKLLDRRGVGFRRAIQ